MVFQELAPSQAHKVKNRNDLESELFGGSDNRTTSSRVRDNEGEAAEYGVYFDDSDYDYMQHMRDLNSGTGDGESYFVEALVKRKEGRGKGKIKLEDALRDVSLENGTSEESPEKNGRRGAGLLEDEILPSKNLKKSTYQDQQDVPDVLAGFQPEMDPRLREVLEALEDEAYVDDEDGLFGELAESGEEVSLAEFEELGFEGDESRGNEDGWESDETEKPTKEYTTTGLPPTTEINNAPENTLDHGVGDWMKEFSKFKKAERSKNGKPQTSYPDRQSSIMTGSSMVGGRQKKRKGALTSSTGYSMTSSSLARTEGLTLLDARFDKIEEDYAEDGVAGEDESASVMSGISTSSSQVPPLRSDFDGIMDEFLGEYSMNGRKRIKKGKTQSGIEQLDDIRKALGPAKIRA